MKSLVLAAFGWLLILPVSYASPLPCVVAEDTILTNLTDNQGCAGKGYKRLCSEFSQCIRQYRVCVVGKGGVFKGNSFGELRVSEKSIGFGIDQTLATTSRSYCVMAGIASPSEGMDAWWFYRTFTPNGGWVGEEISDPSTVPKSLAEFSKKTSEDFGVFLIKIRDVLRSPSFKDGEYGYRKGEQP